MKSEAIQTILSDCKEYIDALRECPKGYLLYRGTHYKIPEMQLFESRLKDRKPVNTPEEQHDKINEIFFSDFKWKIRNGVFCYGYTSLDDYPRDLGYGVQFMCFPIGPFKFVYSPAHFDLCGYLYNLDVVTEEIIRKLIFFQDSLAEAISSGSESTGVSNEISVNVDSYYLVHPDHRDALVKMIWG